MNFIRLDKENRSWDRFSNDWESQCGKFDEVLHDFAPASYSTLEQECGNNVGCVSTGVYGLKDEEGSFHAACFLNSTRLKGYAGKVLRVRHLILSPKYDFEDLPIKDYSTVFGNAFLGIVKLSNGELRSDHIKIHYRSPYDRTFFETFGSALKSSNTSGQSHEGKSGRQMV